jgi:hypothetical protein
MKMVETKKYEVIVSKESNDIGVALKTIVIEAKKATADGFQAGTDISQIAIASFQSLMNAMTGMEKLPEEFKKNTPAAVMGMVLPLVDILTAFLVHDEEPQQLEMKEVE